MLRCQSTQDLTFPLLTGLLNVLPPILYLWRARLQFRFIPCMHIPELEVKVLEL